MKVHRLAGGALGLLLALCAPGCMWASSGDLQVAQAGGSPPAPVVAQILTDDGKPRSGWSGWTWPEARRSITWP